MTTLRYPRLRKGTLASDALLMCFYMKHPNERIAPAVVRALELFRERISPYQLNWYSGEGQLDPLDLPAWEKIRRRVLKPEPDEAAFEVMYSEPDPDNPGSLYVDYRGLDVIPLPYPSRENDVSVLHLRLPTEFLEERGPEQVRTLALAVSAELPFNSGYVDFVLCSDFWDAGKTLDLIRPRYPGVHFARSEANLTMNTWVDGVHWMNFLGQPVLGQLGGVAGLREKLTLPGISLQELSGDRVLITLGEQPDTGDVEAGRTLPLHRALARVLEPHLHQWTAKYGNEAPEELLRWDRRFLD